MSEAETPQASTSREAVASAIAARAAASARDVSAEIQERANQEEKRVSQHRSRFLQRAAPRCWSNMRLIETQTHNILGHREK